MFLVIATAVSSFASGQMKMGKPANKSVEAQITALETQGWEAWKNKNAAWFQTNLTEEFLLVNSEGVSNKAQIVKSTPTDCEVKSFSLDNFKFVLLDKDAAFLTYMRSRTRCATGKRFRQMFAHPLITSNAAANGSRLFIWRRRPLNSLVFGFGGLGCSLALRQLRRRKTLS